MLWPRRSLRRPQNLPVPTLLLVSRTQRPRRRRGAGACGLRSQGQAGLRPAAESARKGWAGTEVRSGVQSQEQGAARPAGLESAAKEGTAGELKLKRRRGQSSPVTAIWADRRKEAGQEPRHFETGLASKLERSPGPGEGGRGAARGSGGGGSAREGDARAGPLRRGARGRAGQGAAEPRATSGAPRPGGPIRRSPACVPEAAAWLPSTPGPSPPRPAGPPAACRSDICSRLRERLRRRPRAAPETAEGRASAAAAAAAAAERREEQRGPAGRKRQCAGPRVAPATLGSGGWRRGRRERDCVLLIAGF